MLITSHLVATLLLGKALSLGKDEFIVALLGGVSLDADHLFVNSKWISDVKNFLRKGTITHGEVKQHSFFQEPLAGLFIGTALGFAISAFFPVIRWWIFPLFQALHIFMDACMSYEHEPLVPLRRWKYKGWLRSGSGFELGISLLALGAMTFLI